MNLLSLKGRFVKKIIFKAFTLAEVLIVVGIIGVIAEMTIPLLVSDFQEHVTAIQYKKYILKLHKL